MLLTSLASKFDAMPSRTKFPSLTTHALLAVAAAVAIAIPGVARAQAPDIIKGHVTGPNAVPLAGAAVTATARDRSAHAARTDASGAYAISAPAGLGPYAVTVTHLGFKPLTKPAPEPVAGAVRADLDFRLDPAVQLLAPITTRAQRQRVQRSDADRVGVGEAGRDNVAGTVGADLSGDITSAMATVPGLLVTPDPNGGLPVISAFGLAGDQNSLTLNGMNFGAGGVPRDGLVLRVSSSTYDPGRGGFSGVQTSLRLPSGTNLVLPSLHITYEGREFQGTQPISSQLGNQYTRGILSGSLSGPIVEDNIYYSTSYQVGRRSSDLVSLSGVNAASLQALGISEDSVRRLTAVAGQLGIPVSNGAVPSDRVSTNGSFLSRFDWAPNVSSRAGNVLYLLAGGTFSDNSGARSGATALPSHGGDTRNWGAQLQLNSSRFIGNVLNEGNVAFVAGETTNTPYLFLPDARILVNSSFTDGTAGSATVRVGGNAGAENHAHNSSVQLRDETSWFTMNNRHQFKVTFDGRIDHDEATQNNNRLGTYSYNSLSDFALGKPASFTRTLGSRETRGAQFLGAIGVGDIFRPIPALRIQYGVRVEGNAFGEQPALNPTVASLFGRNTSDVPGAITIAPMVGFTRNYQRWRGGSFTGGIREYVGTLSSQTVEGVLRQTGLPDAVQQISCVGTAVPTPAWSAYAASTGAIPSACTNTTSFSQTTPPVSVFASGYDPSRRWGASLGWNARLNAYWIGSVVANYSLNLHRPGTFDLNFNAVTKFSLAAEGGRPVYVSPSSIAPTSGSVASTDSRRVAQYAQVSELRSDLRSEAQQLTFGLASVRSGRPAGAQVQANVRAFYTFTDNRDQTRGFGGSTAGDPRAVEWSGSGLPKHAFQLLGSLQLPGWGNLDAFARFASGRRYTPMVSGDINGDGSSNDRAFVFNPSTAGDAVLTNGMNALLNAAPAAARACLQAQLGKVSARNSCDGPWTQSLNMAFSLDPGRFGLGDRASISLVVSNVLAAADQLLHGAAHLHYWGVNATPDATLLNVRGFDATANRFRYDVNPLFGSLTASRSTARVPFVIALDVRMKLGPDRDAQQIRGFLKPGRNDVVKVLSAEMIKERLDLDARNNFEDLAKRKSAVKLTADQVKALNGYAGKFDKYRDSVYTQLSQYMAALNGNYLTTESRRLWHDAFVSIARQYVIAGPAVRLILGEEQFATFPLSLTAFFDMDMETFDRVMKNADFGTLLALITGEGPEG